ncbi:MAG: hypothetical protein A2Y03_09515 [Omnitrophica WOR_2 bacterium GWF2_38_59]|nr:MAG: hypothetical protein A2Y03_09515 [Omnitrophica WOR_2 bacterium GWF2_38_59]OGX49596.1 MAG: hypothetical protein A2243_11720 [Omnitrophica WOR_2 bacterium RIFOXYA2_FULL_38_17]OGX52642.1 MAG: hypothetical protein A2267_10470 [Omnitrophica WOR_2 bacterium RIFOXYA12_FULL_38_10]OGX58878.1 MAG: hypothetical protein A2306_10820 [Omnitrophica WOR_2 bacterium RIFOXYB2_FULL_38_16]OGX59451.1 MAG: hypothetical protein A2447_06180 [Omnitrophica WOR_2 bacterium RIFOXYC2_FULL_38_12]
MRIVLVYIDNHKKIVGHVFSDEWLICKAVDLPLGLASVRTYSRQDPLINKECQFINRIYIDTLSNEAIADDILSQDPDIVGFSCNLWNFEKTKSVSSFVKGKNSNIKIVFGGPMVPDDVESNKLMLDSNSHIDVLIRGEGELAFKQLLKYYLNKETISNIPNTALREGNKVFVSEIRSSLKDLSELPSPYLTGDVMVQDDATGLVALETSRGCIFDCAYCRYHGGERPRFFNIERLKEEIEYLRSKNFKGTVFLTDALLNADPKWAKNVLRVLEGIDFKICIDVRPELIDDEMINLFTKIPGLAFSVGLQSINPEALKNINRPTNIKKCREAIIKLGKSGVNTGIDLILGLPGDNYEKFKKTLDWVVYCKADQVDINDLIIIPNSNLENSVKKFEIKTNKDNMVLSNYSFTEEDMVKASHFKICFQFLHGFYQKLFFKLVFKFRFKPSDIIEIFIREANKRGEIPAGRLLDLTGIYFSDKTILSFLKCLFDDRITVKHFLKLFTEQSERLKENVNYRLEFIKTSE